MMDQYREAVRQAIDIQRGAMAELLVAERGKAPEEVQRTRYERFKQDPAGAVRWAAQYVPAAQAPHEAARFMATMERRFDHAKRTK